MDAKMALKLTEMAETDGIGEILHILAKRNEQKIKVSLSDNNPRNFSTTKAIGSALEDIHNAAEFIKQLTKVINYG